MHRFRQLSLFAACILVLGSSVPSSAQTIIDEWPSVKAPPAPELKNVTIDPKTSALLMLDFVKQNCNEKVRPRCPATLPAAKQLLAGARGNNVLVVYSIVDGNVIGDTVADVAPIGNEPVVQSGAQKFVKTDLEKILRIAASTPLSWPAPRLMVLYCIQPPRRSSAASKRWCPWIRCRRLVPTLSNMLHITSRLPPAS